jgi:enoyl-CoA hydratase
MAYETIICEKEGATGIITFNRPERRNAFSMQFIGEMHLGLDEMKADEEVRVLILTGGDKFFSAGMDLKDVKSIPMPAEDQELGRAFFRKVENFPRPVIAAISGACVAGGPELIVCCDLRIASDSAFFGLSEILFGALPIGGAMHRLPRIIGMGKAKEMIFTGENIDAQEAYRIGLVNKVAPVASMMDEAKAMANKLAELSAPALKLAKFVINKGMNMDLDTALAYDTYALADLGTPEELAEARRKAAEKSGVYKKLFGQLEAS